MCKNPTAKEFRPFCSERCRTADLANWASGTYAIPLEDAPLDESEQDTAL